jgi:uncharacterized protein YqeY
MLVETLRLKITAAVRSRDFATRDVLRVALGEIQTLGSKAGRATPVSDEEAQKIIRKMVTNNREMIGSYDIRSVPENATVIAVSVEKLRTENAILESLLPKSLAPDEIRVKLEGLQSQLAEAKSEGQAVGIAMKFFKAQGATVSGDDVKTVVTSMRANAQPV